MKNRIMGPMVLLMLLAGAMVLMFWRESGLVHSGPTALIGVGLLTGALMKFARPVSR